MPPVNFRDEIPWHDISPPTYSHLLEEEGRIVTTELTAAISDAVALRDYKGVMEWVGYISTLSEVHHSLSIEQRTELVYVLTSVVFDPTWDLRSEEHAEILSGVTKLLKPEPEVPLVIEWQQLWKLVNKHLFPSIRNAPNVSGHYFEDKLLPMMHVVRPYLNPGCVPGILRTASALISPSDPVLFKALGLLCTFIPERTALPAMRQFCHMAEDESPEEVGIAFRQATLGPMTAALDLAVQMWEMAREYHADSLVLNLFNRLALTRPDIDWSKYAQLFSDQLTRVCELPIGQQQSSQFISILSGGRESFLKPAAEVSVFTAESRSTDLPNEAIGSLMVRMMRPGPDCQVLPQLSHFISYLEPLCHPNNEMDSWGETLAGFLRGCAWALSQRYAQQRAPELTAYRNSLGRAHPPQMSEEQYARLVSVMVPPFVLLTYRAQPMLVNAGLAGLRQLNAFWPRLAWPRIVRRIDHGLTEVNKPRLSKGSIQLILYCAQSIVDRSTMLVSEVDPAGEVRVDAASDIPRLMNALLPYLDPNNKSRLNSSLGALGSFFEQCFLVKVDSDAKLPSLPAHPRRTPEGDKTLFDFGKRADEFAVAFFRGILRVMGAMHLSPGGKRTGMFELSNFQAAVYWLLQHSCNRVQAKVAEFLLASFSTSIYSASTKEVAVILQSLTLVNPRLAITTFFPFLSKQLLDKSGGLIPPNATRTPWHLLILSSIARYSGTEILDRSSFIRSVMSQLVTLVSEDTSVPLKVIRAVAKTLRSLGRGLLMQYPREKRAISPALWNHPKFPTRSIALWGIRPQDSPWELIGLEPPSGETPAARLQFEWHRPTFQSVDLAADMLALASKGSQIPGFKGAAFSKTVIKIGPLLWQVEQLPSEPRSDGGAASGTPTPLEASETYPVTFPPLARVLWGQEPAQVEEPLFRWRPTGARKWPHLPPMPSVQLATGLPGESGVVTFPTRLVVPIEDSTVSRPSSAGPDGQDVDMMASSPPRKRASAPHMASVPRVGSGAVTPITHWSGRIPGLLKEKGAPTRQEFCEGLIRQLVTTHADSPDDVKLQKRQLKLLLFLFSYTYGYPRHKVRRATKALKARLRAKSDFALGQMYVTRGRVISYALMLHKTRISESSMSVPISSWRLQTAEIAFYFALSEHRPVRTIGCAFVNGLLTALPVTKCIFNHLLRVCNNSCQTLLSASATPSVDALGASLDGNRELQMLLELLEKESGVKPKFILSNATEGQAGDADADADADADDPNVITIDVAAASSLPPPQSQSEAGSSPECATINLQTAPAPTGEQVHAAEGRVLSVLSLLASPNHIMSWYMDHHTRLLPVLELVETIYSTTANSRILNSVGGVVLAFDSWVPMSPRKCLGRPWPVQNPGVSPITPLTLRHVDPARLTVNDIQGADTSRHRRAAFGHLFEWCSGRLRSKTALSWRWSYFLIFFQGQLCDKGLPTTPGFLKQLTRFCSQGDEMLCHSALSEMIKVLYFAKPRRLKELIAPEQRCPDWRALTAAMVDRLADGGMDAIADADTCHGGIDIIPKAWVGSTKPPLAEGLKSGLPVAWAYKPIPEEWEGEVPPPEVVTFTDVFRRVRLPGEEEGVLTAEQLGYAALTTEDARQIMLDSNDELVAIYEYLADNSPPGHEEAKRKQAINPFVVAYWKTVCQSGGPAVTMRLLEVSSKDSTASKHRRMTASAELFAGAHRAVKHWPLRTQCRVWRRMREVLADALDRSESAMIWRTAVSNICTDVDPRLTAWLMEFLYAESVRALDPEAPLAAGSRAGRVLAFAMGLLELGERGSLWASKALHLCTSYAALSQPLQTIQNAVARLALPALAFLSMPAPMQAHPHHMHPDALAFFQLVRQQLVRWDSLRAGPHDSGEGLVFVNFCKTVTLILAQIIGGSIQHLIAYIVSEFLEVCLDLLTHPIHEVSTLWGAVATGFGRFTFPPATRDRVMLETLPRVIARHTSAWHSRVVVVELLTQLTLRHIYTGVVTPALATIEGTTASATP